MCVHVCVEERKHYHIYERGAYTKCERLIHIIHEKK